MTTDPSDDTDTDEDPVDEEDQDLDGPGDLEDQCERLLDEAELRGMADRGVGTYSELAHRDDQAATEGLGPAEAVTLAPRRGN